MRQSNSSSPSATPAPPPGNEGRDDEGTGRASLPRLPSLRPGGNGPTEQWPAADPEWEGWTEHDWRAWPDWVEGFRPHQLEAVDEILDAYRRGADVVFLDAPTGAGKTLIGEMVRRITGDKTMYVCHSLGLQDQFKHDFPYSKVLKGKANYPTQKAPFPEVTCADCDLTGRGEEASCTWCPEPAMCGYQVAKAEALEAPITIINTAYLLAEANSAKRVVDNVGLVIADEADTLEQILMGYVEYRLSARQMRKLGVEMPKKGSHSKTLSTWMLGELLSAMTDRFKVLVAKGKARPQDVDVKRERFALMRVMGRTRKVAQQILGEGWVRDYDRSDAFILKPVHVSDEAPGILWRHGQKWLCMSATLVSTDEMVESLGMDGLKVETVTVPMTFPVENRRIHAVPVATMTAKGKEEAWPKMAEAVLGVQRLHPDEKILVHTVSYDLARYLALNARGEGRQVFTYDSSQFREGQVKAFKEETRPAIMFAPSLDRGFDFKGDEARVVVVCKIPYPYLGDQQVAARLHTRGGQNWYTVQTVRSLVQMTGRGVRSKDDWAVTYVLDGSFYKLWKEHKRLLPKWWREAVDTRTTKKDLGL